MGGEEYFDATKQRCMLKKVQPGQLVLVDLVSMSKCANSTDLRDKLYALSNLARDRQKSKFGGNGQFIHLGIDYTQPVEIVYVDAAKAMVAFTRIQDLLESSQQLQT